MMCPQFSNSITLKKITSNQITSNKHKNLIYIKKVDHSMKILTNFFGPETPI